jgi:hypothetical protein
MSRWDNTHPYHPKNKTKPHNRQSNNQNPNSEKPPKRREGGHEYTTLTTTDLRGRLTGKIWADRVGNFNTGFMHVD